MIKPFVYKFSEKGVKRKVSSYNNGDSERMSQNKALFKLAIEEAMGLKIREIEAGISYRFPKRIRLKIK